MGLTFRKVERKVLAGEYKDQVRVFASPKMMGKSSLDKICDLVSARASVSSADVKSVLDSLNWAMALELRDGKIVQLGELGNFRLSFGSEGADSKEAFHVSMIRKVRVLFTPGSALRNACEKNTFEQLAEAKSGADCDLEHV